MSKGPRHSYLPDFNLTDLSVDDLIDLYNFVSRFHGTFDTGGNGFGRPFTRKSTAHPGCIEDTDIGEIVSSIDVWVNHQTLRILERLRLVKPEAMSTDENDYRASILMADAVRDGDWAAARKLFDQLEADGLAIEARR
jgi:hypothetical protein